MLTRDIKITILGNTGVGKTALTKRLSGDSPLETEKTLEITVETKKIKLLSAKEQSVASLERYRSYKIVAVDSPGDYKLRRSWREAMSKYSADGILFMVDPSQSAETQRVAMEDAFNYYLDSIDLNPKKADKKAKNKKAIFYFVVNKMDTIDFNKEKGREFLLNFEEVMNDFRYTFPFSNFGEAFISVTDSPYEDINDIFEQMKGFLYG